MDTVGRNESPEGNEMNSFDILLLRDQVVEVLKTCYDPEIPVNIYELGLIYDVGIDTKGAVSIAMTLTSPMCPAAQSLPPEVKQKVESLQGVSSVRVDVVWEPRWDPSMMSDSARLALNM